MSCFLPFFIVPLFTNLFNLGSVDIGGIVNDAGHIITFFTFSGLTIIGYCLSFMQKYSDIIKKQTATQKIINPTKKAMITHSKAQSITQYSYFLMNIFIPIFVTINNRVIFFILVTPIIIWRFYYTIINRKVYNLFENIIRISGKIVWIIYHFAFLFLYIL